MLVSFSSTIYTIFVFSGSVEKDGLQHPLMVHIVGYFGKEQTLKDEIKICIKI